MTAQRTSGELHLVHVGHVTLKCAGGLGTYDAGLVSPHLLQAQEFLGGPGENLPSSFRTGGQEDTQQAWQNLSSELGAAFVLTQQTTRCRGGSGSGQCLGAAALAAVDCATWAST